MRYNDVISGNAITFTSEVILHHTPAWQERAKKAHELWPSISMYMHPALIPKTAELSTGTM